VAAGDMTPLVQISNLTITYSHKRKLFTAVKGVCFDIFNGETLGLVGESGSGKSTIARALVGLIKTPFESIIFHIAKKDVQLVFQDTAGSLNPRMTIEEIIKEPLVIHSTSKHLFESEVIKAMELVGLPYSLLSHYPHELSGGQKARVCIARALILKPRLIIFDESLASLDVSIQAQIINLLIDLRERFNLTYLFISHDLPLVRFLCNRVAVMHEGVIVEIGSAEKIYENPEHPYTKELVESQLFFVEPWQLKTELELQLK
jgi:ABC-type dipeptide/oligopeptide/nickel transport system ATPase subunit